LSQYNQAVVDAGKYKGKQVLFQLGYSPCYLYTIQEKCQKFGVELPKDGITLDELPDTLQPYTEKM
jgi:hypothetical protein